MESKFTVKPHHGANLDRHLAKLGKQLVDNETKILESDTLSVDEIEALHKDQVRLSGIYQWVQNIKVKYFPGLIEVPPTNGMRIIN